MKYEVEVANSFKKNFKKLLKRYHNICDDLETLIANLEIDPYIGADLGNGIRKIRMAISDKGKGKSHGARVITFTVEMNEDHGTVTLLSIYDKKDRESITQKEIDKLLKEL